jgi:hypothetical protein
LIALHPELGPFDSLWPYSNLESHRDMPPLFKELATSVIRD